MAFDKAYEFLKNKGLEDRVKEFELSTATVELAAIANGTDEGSIAKSLTFLVDEKAIMILCAGDYKIDNPKYKAEFHTKAKMLSRDQLLEMVGHDIGGVCPFGIKEGVKVYLDESLKTHEIVYPACGSDNSAVKLSIAELEKASDYDKWIDVCKEMEK
ncbi:MAG: YbaK/EbsC family protein [Clostridia bacterium]|nr:YbaK/EbsC family protein [Clostridia bacterium]